MTVKFRDYLSTSRNFLGMFPLKSLSEIFTVGCVDTCLDVCKRISDLEEYLLVKKFIKVVEYCNAKTGITVYMELQNVVILTKKNSLMVGFSCILCSYMELLIGFTAKKRY